MAGVKGKSGGPRPNSGGTRAGAGRKPKAVPAKSANAAPMRVAETDMLKLLQDVALGYVDASTIQVRAAIAAVQYTHTKKGDGGKKEAEADKAKAAAAGKYGMRQGPRLVSSK